MKDFDDFIQMKIIYEKKLKKFEMLFWNEQHIFMLNGIVLSDKLKIRVPVSHDLKSHLMQLKIDEQQ
jgi:hypothetical protein